MTCQKGFQGNEMPWSESLSFDRTSARPQTVRCAPVDTVAAFVRMSRGRVGCLECQPSVRDSVCQRLRLSLGVFVHLSCSRGLMHI